MTNAIPKAPTTDFTSTTLNGSINDSVTTIAVNDASTIQVPTYAVIDREDNNGTATPTQREVIYISNKSVNSLTVTRGVNSSTARAHNDSAKLEPLITVGFWEDTYTALAVSLKSTGEIVTASTATLSAVDARSLSLASVATIRQAYFTNYVNASGASLVGVYPSGASGSILTANESGKVVFATNVAATGGFSGLFWVPGSLASQANVGGLILSPTTYTASFISAYVQTPASVASVSAHILKNGADFGVVGILAGANFGSSASIANTAIVAGDRFQLDINSTASIAADLSVLLRAT